MSVFASIAKGIESFAPTLATMLGGPLAGTAVTALEGVLGLTPDKDCKLEDRAGSIATILQNAQLTGEQIVKMRELDNEHKERIAQQQIDLVKINNAHQEAFARDDVEDRNSARQREIAVKDGTPAKLAYMIIGGFFVVSIAQLVALIGFADAVAKIPPAGWVLIGNISGYLAAEAKAAASYFFGTTSSSRAKDDTIKAQAEAAQSD